MRKFLLAVFLITVITPLQAGWVELSRDSEKGETHYFDPETTQNNGHLRKVWALSNYNKKQVGGHHSVKTFYEFDCKEKKVRSKTMLLYSGINASGDIVGAHHKESEDWSKLSPNSIFDQLSETLCAVD